MMRELREKTKWVMVIVALTFVGLMVFQWGMDISGRSAVGRTGELGRVNGEPVPYDQYNAAYQALYDQARAQYGTAQLSREQIREIENRAFDEVVNEILIGQELRRRNIRVSDSEIIQAAQWMPHPDLMQNELFLTDGQFDISKYQQFISGPSANEDLLRQLEVYYRSTIPRSKLIRQITSGAYLSDAELWQIWRDRNETVTVEYVPLNVSVLVPGSVEVSDSEVREYYNQNKKRFVRPATARMTLAYISKAATAADSVAAYQKALELRQEILNGAPFAEVAARESDDPGSKNSGGDLGTFTSEQMVPAFSEVAFSLPVGEVSQPVQTEFGFHLIQVRERTGNQASASHILVSYDPGDEALDALYVRADSLESLAGRGGIERAAGAVGATFRTGVVVTADAAYVPGIGSAIEALEWIEENRSSPEPTQVSSVFETPEAFYIVAEEDFLPAGQIPLAEATPEIQRQLIVDHKLEQARTIGEAIVAEVRGGKSLEEAAGSRGLTVETAGPITRLSFNPAFGQTNAVVGAAFGVPVGQVSNVVGTPGGLYLVRPTDRTEASREEFEAQKEIIRQSLLYTMQQDALARWMEDIRREANIIDRRAEMRVGRATGSSAL
ncbi:MAG: peptidylprolyl isomerase [Gemmatimonadota bacterium]|jgi:peptidyl-prolyl cis-trans isomerase D|nr:peptidylprolyl isomerase [Gemmatimonadota bacterium]